MVTEEPGEKRRGSSERGEGQAKMFVEKKGQNLVRNG